MSPTPDPRPALPTETWIEILAEHGLSYFDLKRVAGVSKEFKALTQSPALDHLLFRGGNRKLKPAAKAKITLHPAIEATMSFIADVFIIVNYHDEQETLDKKTCQLPCVGEWATSPPISRIHFYQLGPGGSMIVETGITILDFLDGVARTWSPLVPRHLVTSEPIRVLFDEDVLLGTRRIDRAEYQMHFDHSWWSGWMDPRVALDRVVVFQPHYYDS